jgi:hypothetical protein
VSGIHKQTLYLKYFIVLLALKIMFKATPEKGATPEFTDSTQNNHRIIETRLINKNEIFPKKSMFSTSKVKRSQKFELKLFSKNLNLKKRSVEVEKKKNYVD